MALTLALVKTPEEKALQISAVPGWEFDLLTRVQLSPAPETAVTWFPEPDGPSAAIKASNSSLPADELNRGEETVELEAEPSAHVCTSTLNTAVDVVLCPAKLTPVAFAPFTDTPALVGVNEYPVFEGVIVYEPFVNAVKVKFPEVSAVVVPLAAPLRVRVAPDPAATGLTFPEIE